MIEQKSIWQLLENSHLIIAFSAIALFLETKLYLNQGLYDFWLIPIGLGSIIFYGIHRTFQYKKYSQVKSQRISSLGAYRRTIAYSSLSALLLLFFYLVWHPETILHLDYLLSSKLLLIFSLLGVFYLTPWNKSFFRLRDIPYLKIFILSIGWAIITVFFPYHLPLDLLSTKDWIFFMERALFIFTITLPFEIRDLNDDENVFVKTIGTRMGVRGTLQLMRICAFIGIVVACTLKSQGLPVMHFLSIGVVYVLLFVSTFYVNKITQSYQYTLIWDGMMIGRFVIFYILKSTCLI